MCIRTSYILRVFTQCKDNNSLKPCKTGVRKLKNKDPPLLTVLLLPEAAVRSLVQVLCQVLQFNECADVYLQLYILPGVWQTDTRIYSVTDIVINVCFLRRHTVDLVCRYHAFIRRTHD